MQKVEELFLTLKKFVLKIIYYHLLTGKYNYQTYFALHIVIKNSLQTIQTTIISSPVSTQEKVKITTSNNYQTILQNVHTPLPLRD